MGTSSSPNGKGEEPENRSEKHSISRDIEKLNASLRDATQGIVERAQVTDWLLTAGLVGFIVLVSGDLGAEVMRNAPLLLTSLMLTFTLGSGLTLILSRSSLLSSKKNLERASEIHVKVDELWSRWLALVPETSEVEKTSTLPENEQKPMLKLLEELHLGISETKSLIDTLMNESSRQVDLGSKRSRWGRYLFNASMVLALLAAMSFLASVWSPTVKAWWPVVSTWLSAVLQA